MYLKLKLFAESNVPRLRLQVRYCLPDPFFTVFYLQCFSNAFGYRYFSKLGTYQGRVDTIFELINFFDENFDVILIVGSFLFLRG